jgi:polyketide synthase PksN
MKDFLEYILCEVKNKRLLKTDAVDLIRQFQTKVTAEKYNLLHPLLHKNTSDLSKQRFSSIFTGQEFFLKDHVVKGQRVLPGVAYLEMARTAVEQAAGLLLKEKTGMRLRNVVWTRPIVVGEEPVQVHIGLFPEENGEIAYEIYSQPDGSAEENVVHSQGNAAFVSSTEEMETLDLKVLQAECSQGILSSVQCYEAFGKMGIVYGPGHQGIEKLYVGLDKVVAKLTLPSSVMNTQDQFILHPSVMDSALQTSMGLMIGSGDIKPALPFALQELEVIQKCTSSMWALVRYSADCKAGDKVQKLDIDLCDEQGIVCVRIKGFSARILEGEINSEVKEKIGMLMYQPSWKEQQAALETIVPEYIQHVVMLCELNESTREDITSRLPEVRCIILQAGQKNIEERFLLYAVQIFREIKNILNDKPKGQVLIQIVISSQKEQRLFSGLSGLLKTAHHENSKLIGQMIEVEDAKELAKKLQKESSMGSIDNQVRYQGGKRWIADWSEIENSQDTVKIPWKNQGIYLITGGAGGLGLIFAQDIAHQVRDTTLIFTGRSVLTAEKQAKLKEIEALGARIEYRQVDVTDKKAVSSLIQSIQKELGSLNGILHCAGVIRDNFILKKTEEELQEVLAPKVSGLVNLDQASKEMQLDFFILFSSIAGSLGNPGQADYAAANAFMDAYAEYRNDLVVLQQRQGQTLSINWPLWKDGGMRVDEETEKMMMHSMGMITMQTSTGIQALYQSVAAGKNQVMIMEGKAVRMKQKLLSATSCILAQPNKISVESAAATGIDPSHLLDKVQAALMHAVSQLLKVKLEDIDVHTELNEYGFDSITFTEFANKLNQDYKIELTPTVFFEYPTIQSFAEYLIEEYPTLFVSKFVVSTDVVAQEQVVEKELEEFQSNKSRRSRFAPKVILSEAKQEEKVPEPIAIVGMTGKFPQAKDLDEFWENLMEGKDCIVEIPKQRWDWQKYYGDPAKEVNKTNIKWGGFIDGVDEFDPLFFGISPREAELMDPQQRLLMTYAWKVIEDAGYSPQDISGTQTGIFVGTGSSGYDRLISKANIAIEGYSSTGIVPSVGPNRMSYLLNIHGPSEPIETACSSSLVAIHRAVNAIENGTCEMAIVGGVNTIVTPDPYISFSKAGMLSEDGRCKTFSDQANGYVRGEGVGMLFLKKLKDAELAGDHIYGVIRGTAENHGGRANSLTAPNPKAQAKLLQTAYTKAGVDPRTVTYIEAHGTGTELGDPIEINGLKAAFKELYEATGDPKVTSSHCGLGSVKTNIGHLELSAGVAGVIKVLLQLKHKTLVKSLHCDRMNPYIQLQDSPFYIVQETKEWKSLQDGEGKDIPCRAGVSSFGFGGVNAHVVIEEYIPKKQGQPPIEITAQKPAIIVLSAKNDELLKEQVHELLVAIEEQQFSDIKLSDMAYTLQVGRIAMEERLAMVVGSIKEMGETLKSFENGQGSILNLYRGQVKRNKETLAIFAADEDMELTINAWISKGKYAKLLDLWVKGLSFDWNKLYDDSKPRRISLPTYPFAKERYWVPENKNKSVNSSAVLMTAAAIHPLLHQNTSNFSEQRFSSTFTGQEFFLADHVVKGQRVLPGVAYLELARAAVDQAVGVLEEGKSGIQLKNVVWNQPIRVGEQAVQVHIGLFPEENGEISYEIYSQAEETGAEPTVHSQGNAVLSSIRKVEMLDIKTLQAECNQSVLSATQCYEAFKARGIDYGPGYQGIEMVYVGATQVLAKLSLPPSVLETQEQFVLHPSLLDSALQASIGFIMGCGDVKQALPITLKQLGIIGNCTSIMWALLRYSDGNTRADKVQKLDIDLCDDQGNVCVQMKGIETQENVITTSLEARPQSAVVSQRQEDFEMMTFEEVWQEQALLNVSPTKIKTMVCFLSNPENQQVIVEMMQRLNQETKVIFVSQSTTYQKQSQPIYKIFRSAQNMYREAFQNIREEYGEVDGMLYLWPLEDSTCIQDYSSIVCIVKSIASAKLKTKRLLLAAQFENGVDRCYLESWIGFERSLGLILPNTQVGTIYQEAGEENKEITMKDWLEKLWGELQTHKTQSVLYQEGKRHVCQVKSTTLPPGNNVLKSGGTYLITGGCGGLGMLFAKHFAKSQSVKLILTGRSPMDEEKEAKIKELEELGSQVLYVQADVCNLIGMKEGLTRAKERFGAIHGVIHAAGIAGNQSILEKDIRSFQQVLDPKIKGTMVLDELLDEEVLDFVCYFSSSAAILGDFGSCDYAIGNRFEMSYAHYRNQQQRQGKSIVVNWPLWKDGGMGVGEDENTKMYLKSSGQRFLESEEGTTMFDRILSQTNTQHLVLVGQPSRVERFLGLTQEQASTSSSMIRSLGKGRRIEMKGLSLEQCLEWDLKEHMSQLLKIPREKLDREENLADFGFDSINLAQFAALLSNYYEIEITPALFFGYSTIGNLTQYFLEEHHESIQEFYQGDLKEQISAQRLPSVVVTPKRQGFKKCRFAVRDTIQSVSEPIAIIGMSGRFPQARNIDEMWQILADGKDVVEEFPEERLSNKNVGKTKYKCGCIPGVSEFDPLFFEISPREAESMDPRQRLLLQESWRALEDAGYGEAHIKSSKIGMFVGVEEGDYKSLIKNEGSITSNHTAVLASRLAYFLNLSGPVMAINTACSSGLVATHQACSSLRNQECDTAVAAGVSLMLTLESHVGMSQAGMLSEDGKCFAFDKRANGMVPGEAVAVVVLKRLSQAEVDGDPIYAIIQGSGINYDGKTNGITAPSGVAQTKLLKSIYNQYKIKPEEIEYVVTHGTGTKLGDPIEINALYDVFKDYTKKQGYCALTSTKTNFGHCLAASGLVSLISLVQAFQHEIIPGSLNCDQENDYIHWQESPFYVNKASKPWPQRQGKSRLGAVSAFGMSGTNSHIVLQSYSKKEIDEAHQAPYYLLAFSAKTQDALEQKIKDIMNGLYNKNWQGQSLSQISYTLQEGRQHFNHRCAIVIQDREDAIHVLKQVGRGEKLPNLFQGTVCRGFTGQKAIEEYMQDLLKQGQSMKANEKKYQEILYAIAEFYCQGYEIPWRLLYGESKPGRIHLPSYPFAKEQYWVSKNNNSAELNISNGPKLITGGEANSRSQLNKEVPLDVVLKQVYEGTLDIKQANQLLQQFYLNEEIK